VNSRAIGYALLSAALFGASTPLAKLLVGGIAPLALAGVLYLGIGLGLGIWLLIRRKPLAFARADWPWLLGAIAAGGVAGPALLMYGLRTTDGASASLLLNLEAVFTAVLAWVVFRENVDKRIFIGMVAIVAGGALLSFGEAPKAAALIGPLLIAAACLAWALDNNLTRRVSGGDAVALAALKGAVAGMVNLSLALAIGAYLPAPAGLKSPALWGTEPHIVELFGPQAAAIRCVRKNFNFRYASSAHWVQMFRDFYGPTHKAFAALQPDAQARLERDIVALLERLNVAGKSSLVVPGEYLEVVIVKQGRAS
jgi:drug/metabolite transporter (DMT)-like permease